MRRFVALVLGLTIGLGFMGSAWAQTAANQRFTVVFIGGAPGRVVASGVINGVGTDITESSTVLPNGDIATEERLIFPAGQLFVTTRGTPGAFEFNPRTCVGSFTSTGTAEVTGGTGRYAGASGEGTFQVQGYFVGGRTATGECSEDPADELVSVTVVRAAFALDVPGLAAA